MRSRLSRHLLMALGWSLRADFPAEKKYVLIVAPHTSNWDFPLGLLASWALQLDAHWLGKHTLFRWPFGWFFRALGGLPVRRDQALKLSEQIGAMFADSEQLVVALAPEGTRSRTDHWKSGFYHVARAGHVPIAMVCLDYGKKQIVLGGTFNPGNDIEESFGIIRAFFAHRHGKRPENESDIRTAAR
jgi:1-acyl-sn-glycerol-3-phosphate acyltransferase